MVNRGEILPVIHGDCLEVMKRMDPESVDAIVTDPPAGISFMGKEWDHDKGGRDHWIEWMTTVAIECLRVIKPGGHALVWSLPRTSHWTATAWENAGWEIRDKVVHIFGTGFPKSTDISKQLDKAAGVEREVIGTSCGPNNSHYDGDRYKEKRVTKFGVVQDQPDLTAPTTDAAKQWNGWGTALKPAHEDWILLRKPVEGTIAQNVLKHGVGGINIDGCRVAYQSKADYENLINNYKGGLERATPETQESWNLHEGGWKLGKGITLPEETKGRFPANLVLDDSDEVLALFPHSTTGAMNKPYLYTNNGYSLGKPAGSTKSIHGKSEGSAARFFYCAKASKSERGANNKHPTVKALSLMRYLCKLITPPGGIVLDPFAGSGSTGVAAKQEGFQSILIELEQESFNEANARMRNTK